MNDPATVSVRPAAVHSGSAAGRAARFVDDTQSSTPDGPPTNRVVDDAGGAEIPDLFDWVPASERGPGSAGDYPIECGVPHPRWVPERAEHRIASGRIPIDESAAVVRLLLGLAVAAFLLGLTVFYPVSPLGR